MAWETIIPIWVSFVIFIIISCIFSLIGLWLFKKANIERGFCKEQNNIVSIFIATVSVFVGILISYTISSVSEKYYSTVDQIEFEGNIIYLLYATVHSIPGTGNVQRKIIEYTRYIIHHEFPSNNNGNEIYRGDDLSREIQEMVYDIRNTDPNYLILQTKAIDYVNQMIELRITRLNNADGLLSSIFWLILLVNCILVLFLSWFLTCPGVLHYLLVSITAIYLSTSIFAILILSFPFNGYLSINSNSYQDALDNIEKLN